MDGLELSTDKLDLAAPDRCDLTRVLFMRFRGPQALKEGLEDDSMIQEELSEIDSQMPTNSVLFRLL